MVGRSGAARNARPGSPRPAFARSGFARFASARPRLRPRIAASARVESAPDSQDAAMPAPPDMQFLKALGAPRKGDKAVARRAP
jgi:hypothetical protein